MPHVQGHGGDFGAQYSKQIQDTASKIRGLENTKTFQQIVQDRAQQEYERMQDQRGQPGFEDTLLDDQGFGLIKSDFGKRTGKFNDIRDKLNREGYGALTGAEKVIADFYLGFDGKGSVPTNFGAAQTDFIKFFPGGKEAYLDNTGLLGALNVAATTIPEAVAEKSIFGNIISGALNKGSNIKSKMFPQGIMPGMGDTISDIAEDFAAAPGGLADSFKQMFGIDKDDDPVKGVLREELGVKKNTSNDISPDTFTSAEDSYTQMFGEPMIDLAGGEGPQPLGKVTETNLPAKSQFEPGTLEFIQEQGKKNVEDFPNVLETDKFGQSVLRKLGLLDQAKTVNAPKSVNEIQLAELNPSQKAVLDQRANRFAFDQGLSTPEDMLNKIRPLDRSGILGFGGNEANLQDIIDFYKNNPTTQI